MVVSKKFHYYFLSKKHYQNRAKQTGQILSVHNPQLNEKLFSVNYSASTVDT